MSRAIKVEDQVYQELDMIRQKGETFSQIIETLLAGRKAVFEFMTVLEGKLKFPEWRQQQMDAITKARAERADLASRTL